MRIITTFIISCMVLLCAHNVHKATASELAIYTEFAQHLDAFLQSGNVSFDLERYKQSQDGYLLVHFAITWMWYMQHLYDAETPDIVPSKKGDGTFMVSGKLVQERVQDVLDVRLASLANLAPSPVQGMPAYAFDGVNYYFDEPSVRKDGVYVPSVEGVKDEGEYVLVYGDIVTGFENPQKVGTFQARLTKGDMPRVRSFQCTYEKP